ncbi:MAG: hypothetical protein JST54_01640 [Deltaproteobacteria bacterium]|nr:hypothetical protein [Deltaproteobacteria bacterium]
MVELAVVPVAWPVEPELPWPEPPLEQAEAANRRTANGEIGKRTGEGIQLY